MTTKTYLWSSGLCAGPSVPSTEDQADSNRRLRDWAPGPFYTANATPQTGPGSSPPEESEDTEWAELAARVRAEWSAENPF